MWMVQQLVAGKWLTVDNHKATPPVPRLFHYKSDAEDFADGLATLRQPTKVVKAPEGKTLKDLP